MYLYIYIPTVIYIELLAIVALSQKISYKCKLNLYHIEHKSVHFYEIHSILTQYIYIYI
jgi:hypothetical protein